MVKFHGLKEEIKKLAEEVKYDIAKMYARFNEFSRYRDELTQDTYKRYCRSAVQDFCNDEKSQKIDKNKFIKDLEKEKKELEKIHEENEMLIENIIRAKVSEISFFDERHTVEEGNRTAILQISDVHYGKVVDFRGDDANLNRYNKDIAKRRLTHLFNETEKFLDRNEIENLVITLQGDIVSGIIHEELKYRVNESMMNELFELSAQISFLINNLPSHINVKVLCVSGNHGRISKRWEAEFKATQNFDYLFGLMVKNMCPNIDMEVSESTSKIFNINGKHYIIHHGDFTRGGKNLTGAPAFTASRDSSFMSNKYQKMGYQNIEAILIGHFHTHFYIPGMNVKIIGNASVIGPDSFSVENVLLSDPSQNLVIIDNDGDIESVQQIKLKNIK